MARSPVVLELRPPPPLLVDAAGRVVHGIFDGFCPRANLEDARLAWRGLTLPTALARLRLKRWQHLALILPGAYLAVAVVDLGFLRLAWCLTVDRERGDAFEHRRLGPTLDLRVATELWRERSWARARGFRIELASLLADGEHRLELAIAAAGTRPSVEAQLRCAHDLSRIEPLVVCMPVAPGRSMYSHKVALPLEGTLRVGARRLRADPTTSFAILDVHQAHYPHHTWWRWATFAGRDRRGRALALNLTCNPNHHDDRINENALWLDGALQHLGPARFELDPARPLRPWQLGEAGGAVELTFTPLGERREALRLGLLRSVFHQPYGTFRGSVRFAGEPIEVDGLFGLCEDHDSLW